VTAAGGGSRGAALVDVVFSTGLMAILLAISVPTIAAAREKDTARAAARYVAARLQHARIEALKRNAAVAVRFDPADTNQFAIYVDGDGDGVLQADVDRDVDVLVGTPSRLSDYLGAVRLRLNQDVPEPDTGASLAAGSDPLRIGRSSFLSFSPLGSATSGTLYLAAATGPQMAIRIFGSTGRMRVLRFDSADRQWRED